MRYADILKQKQKDWNCGDLLDRSKSSRAQKIPFSSPLLNWCTYGGIPRGKMTEFFGEPSGGKSTTAIDLCKNAIDLFISEHSVKISTLQDRLASGDKAAQIELDDLVEDGPRRVLYVDLEHSFDDYWASTLKVDTTYLDVLQTPDVPAEEILQMVQDAIESGAIGMVVIDSVPSLVPKAELEKKYGERTVASLAGLMTVFTRKIIPILARYDCSMILINQIRDNMDNPYVVKTPGGEAIKFYSTLRIAFRIGHPVDFLGNELPQNTEDPAGYIINAKLMKQKSAPFDRKNGTYYLMCQSGLRPDFDFAQLAIKKYDVIRKGGAWYTLCDPYTKEILVDEAGKPVKLNGLARVYEYLQANVEYYERLKQYILDDINGVSDDESN